jgi:hypothetical protein
MCIQNFGWGEGKDLLESREMRDTIKMDVREIYCEGVNWNEMAEDHVCW